MASVRPAIGRVKKRSTNAAKPGSRGAKSCSIVTWQSPPSPSRLDPPGHVHPAWSRPRRGRTAGAASPARPGPRTPGHRQPEPRTPIERPARDEVGDERAVRPPLDRRASGRSGAAGRPSARRRGRGRRPGRAGRRSGSRSRCASVDRPPSARRVGAEVIERVPRELAEAQAARPRRRRTSGTCRSSRPARRAARPRRSGRGTGCGSRAAARPAPSTRGTGGR